MLIGVMGITGNMLIYSRKLLKCQLEESELRMQEIKLRMEKL